MRLWRFGIYVSSILYIGVGYLRVKYIHCRWQYKSRIFWEWLTVGPADRFDMLLKCCIIEAADRQGHGLIIRMYIERTYNCIIVKYRNIVTFKRKFEEKKMVILKLRVFEQLIGESKMLLTLNMYRGVWAPPVEQHQWNALRKPYKISLKCFRPTIRLA